LAVKATVAVAHLYQESIFEKSATSLRAAVIEAFEQTGVEPCVRFETGSLEMIEKLVARSLGVGLVPVMCVEEEKEAGTLSVRKVAGLRARRQLWLRDWIQIRRRRSVSTSCRC